MEHRRDRPVFHLIANAHLDPVWSWDWGHRGPVRHGTHVHGDAPPLLGSLLAIPKVQSSARGRYVQVMQAPYRRAVEAARAEAEPR